VLNPSWPGSPRVVSSSAGSPRFSGLTLTPMVSLVTDAAIRRYRTNKANELGRELSTLTQAAGVPTALWAWGGQGLAQLNHGALAFVGGAVHGAPADHDAVEAGASPADDVRPRALPQRRVGGPDEAQGVEPLLLVGADTEARATAGAAVGGEVDGRVARSVGARAKVGRAWWTGRPSSPRFDRRYSHSVALRRSGTGRRGSSPRPPVRPDQTHDWRWQGRASKVPAPGARRGRAPPARPLQGSACQPAPAGAAAASPPPTAAARSTSANVVCRRSPCRGEFGPLRACWRCRSPGHLPAGGPRRIRPSLWTRTCPRSC